MCTLVACVSAISNRPVSLFAEEAAAHPHDAMGASRAVLTQVCRCQNTACATCACAEDGHLTYPNTKFKPRTRNRTRRSNHVSLDVQLVLLGLALGLGQWLEKKKIDWLGEASVALLLGLAMGILARVFTLSHTYVAWMGFQVKHTITADRRSSIPPLLVLPSFIPCLAPYNSSHRRRLNKSNVAVTMQSEFFFLALLPPIMFEAGFSLQVKP
jgi:hypothetical protein